MIERWELLRAQSRQQAGPQEPQRLTSDLDDITSWLEAVIPELELLLQSDPAASMADMESRAKEIKVMRSFILLNCVNKFWLIYFVCEQKMLPHCEKLTKTCTHPVSKVNNPPQKTPKS